MSKINYVPVTAAVICCVVVM